MIVLFEGGLSWHHNNCVSICQMSCMVVQWMRAFAYCVCVAGPGIDSDSLTVPAHFRRIDCAYLVGIRPADLDQINQLTWRRECMESAVP